MSFPFSIHNESQTPYSVHGYNTGVNALVPPYVAQHQYQPHFQHHQNQHGSKHKFESALDFLERVKTKFETQPEVYNRFLEVMKEFKVHNIDTPGVIQRVKQLFAGHPELILGFNTFLPQGHKITEEELYGPQAGFFNNQMHHYVPHIQPIQPPAQSVTVHPILPMQAPITPTNQPNSANTQSQVQAQSSSQPRKPEFEHARNFVKKIKARFAHDPQVYKSFLGILHMYHNEHQSISNVNAQVAKLFKEHHDLIADFTQFLPDLTNTPTKPPSQEDNSGVIEEPRKGGSQVEPAEYEDVQNKPEGKMSRNLRAKRAPRFGNSTSNIGIDTSNQNQPDSILFNELDPFIKVKIAIPRKFPEFLKCLELYNNNILSKHDTLALAKDIILTEAENGQELWNSLREFVGVSADDFSDDDDICLADLDLSNCERNGLSYRKKPRHFKLKECAGRTPLDASVLNDEWISRPTGEEGGFKSSRKNEYEELLFKCEDDRFEWDLNIERSSSAAYALEAIYKEISQLPRVEQYKYKLPEDRLSCIHKIAIRTVYGSRGSDVEKLLMEHPAILIPIILGRLKQKQNEWTLVKSQWATAWRRIYQDYYLRAQDNYTSNYGNNKQRISPTEILEELKNKMQKRIKSFPQESLVPQEGDIVFRPSIINANSSKDVPIIVQHYYSQARSLVATVVEKMFTNNESAKERVVKFFCAVDLFLSAKGCSDFTPSASPQSWLEYKSSTLTSNNFNRIFLADSNLAVIFRLFQMLFSQVETAREFCFNMEKPPSYSPPTLPRNSEDEYDDPSISTIKRDISLLYPSQTTERSSKVQQEGPENSFGEQRLFAFIALVKKLLLNEVDHSTYQDILRESLGVHAYPVFQIHTLIIQIAKQTHVVIQDPASIKLCQIYVDINTNNTDIFKDTPHGERTEKNYYSLVAQYLSEEDRVYRVLHSNKHNNTGASGGWELSISQLDKRWRPSGVPPPIRLIDNEATNNSQLLTAPSTLHQTIRYQKRYPEQDGEEGEEDQEYSQKLDKNINDDIDQKQNKPDQNEEESLSKRNRQSLLNFDRSTEDHSFKPKKSNTTNTNNNTPLRTSGTHAFTKKKTNNNNSTPLPILPEKGDKVLSGPKQHEDLKKLKQQDIDQQQKENYFHHNSTSLDTNNNNNNTGSITQNCIGLVDLADNTLVYKISPQDRNIIPSSTPTHHDDSIREKDDNNNNDTTHNQSLSLLRKFLASPPKESLTHVYLKRNLISNNSSGNTAPTTPVNSNRELVENSNNNNNTLIYQGLQFALDVTELRPVFVEGTQDIFWRKKLKHNNNGTSNTGSMETTNDNNKKESINNSRREHQPQQEKREEGELSPETDTKFSSYDSNTKSGNIGIIISTPTRSTRGDPRSTTTPSFSPSLGNTTTNPKSLMTPTTRKVHKRVIADDEEDVPEVGQPKPTQQERETEEQQEVEPEREPEATTTTQEDL